MNYDYDMDKLLAFVDGNPDLHAIHMFVALSCQMSSMYCGGEPFLLVLAIRYGQAPYPTNIAVFPYLSSCFTLL